MYVGKAKNLKKRVAQHFAGHKITPQRQHFMRDIYSISYEVCATEFMALLLECSEIKKLWPEHNRALKKFDPKYGLYEYEARNGYRYLAIGKLSKLPMYDKLVTAPIMIAWHGEKQDTGESAMPWTPELLALRIKVEKQTGLEFNAVLLNLYRNGLAL